MVGGAERGSECQRTTDGRESSDNGSNKAICVPSCCLKGRASAPELDAKCHSTVVSGWFSESCPSSDKSLNEVYFKPNVARYNASPLIRRGKCTSAEIGKWFGQVRVCRTVPQMMADLVSYAS